MEFIRESNQDKSIILYIFTYLGNKNAVYINRESKSSETKNYIENTIIWGTIKNNIFSLESNYGDYNVYELRSIFFEILDDFESEYVSDRNLEIYNINFSSLDPGYETKNNFAYKSLSIKYGQNNVSLDSGGTIIVFINQ